MQIYVRGITELVESFFFHNNPKKAVIISYFSLTQSMITKK